MRTKWTFWPRRIRATKRKSNKSLNTHHLVVTSRLSSVGMNVLEEKVQLDPWCSTLLYVTQIISLPLLLQT